MQNIHSAACAPAAPPSIQPANALQPHAAHNHHGAAPAGAAALAKSIIRARHQRSRFLPSKLFSDPAWDILLALYAAELGQRRITVGQVCAAADIPATTGLRWLGTLEELDLVTRRADPLDARRFFVSLTAQGREAMSGYLQTMRDVVLAA
jgi:DNA-binding MarR family transcriptional regulator